MKKTVALLMVFLGSVMTAQSAEITWRMGSVDEDEVISNLGTVVEAFAFTGDRGNNALPGTFPLEDDIEVNGTMFTPLNFSLGDMPEHLEGMTYNNGEFGHTEAESGYEALLAGLAFEGGVNPQFLDLTGLTSGQRYQVEFYYYHRTVGRTVSFEDDAGNSVTISEGPEGVGGFASGCFVANGSSQEILSTANTGSHYLNAYQLREIPGDECPMDPPPPPPVRPTPALVGYYNFDDNVNDHSGKGNHGEIEGGVDYDSDVPASLGGGKSASFDGLAGTLVNVQQNEMLPLTSENTFTISMWVKGDGTSGDNNDDRVFSEGMTTDNNPLFNIGTKNDGVDATVDFFFRNGGSPGHLFSQGDAFDNEWHHIAWVDTDHEGTLYIDGEEDSTWDYSGFVTDRFDPDTTTIGGILRATDCCNFTGNIDDVSLFSFALSPEEIGALANGGSPLDVKIPGSLPGDFDGNGSLNIDDLELLASVVTEGVEDPTFDVNGDNAVDAADCNHWVTNLKNSWIGDADLDGEFNSSDFVSVFQSGKFETGEPAAWAEGDWNCDGVFSSGDFVVAFQDGGFERGPREAALAAVPEPSCLVLVLLGVVGLRTIKRSGYN